MTNISEINFNLLKVLDALLHEVHVTAAGKRLGLSQSATSAALKQLRDLLQDPILVRGQGSQMFLTEYAKSLQTQVSKLVEEMSHLFNREKFDPQTSTRVFHVGMSDYLSFVFLPKLITKLNQMAPHIKLIVHHINYFKDAARLENGELDLVLGSFPDAAKQLHSELLYEDYPAFVAHKSHPLFKRKKPMTLKAIVDYPLIMVSFMNDPTDNYLDRLIKSRGLDATVSVVVPHALTALLSLQNNQFITHTVMRIAEPVAKQAGLKYLEMPRELKSVNKIPYVAYQYWYKAADADEGHQWLRDLICATAK